MKKFFSLIFLFAIFLVIYINRNYLTKYIVYNYIYKKDIELPESNSYKRNYEFELFKSTNNFYPENKAATYYRL